MASTTTRYAYPFLESTDPPDIAGGLQDLAEAVEDSVGDVDDRLAVVETDLNTLEGRTSGKPIGRIFQGSSQSIPHNTSTVLTWNSEVYDTASQHSTSVNPSRVTPNVAGYYRFNVCAYLAASTDYTLIRVGFRLNGNEVAPDTRWGPTSATSAQVSSFLCQLMVEFNGTTDYLEVFIQQTNGASAARNTNVGNPAITLLEWEYIRPL